MTDEYSVTVQREIAAPVEDLFDAWLDGQVRATGCTTVASPRVRTSALSRGTDGAGYERVVPQVSEDERIRRASFRSPCLRFRW